MLIPESWAWSDIKALRVVLQLALGGYGLYLATKAIQRYKSIYGADGGRSSLLVSPLAVGHPQRHAHCAWHPGMCCDNTYA